MSILDSDNVSDVTSSLENTTIVEAIASWCDCMSGSAPLKSGLRLLAESLGAKACVVSRIRKDGSRAANTVIYDCRNASDTGPRLHRSFAEIVLGRYFDKSKPGTLWFSSMLDGMVDPALKVFQAQRRLGEVVVLPLCVADRHVDFIEIHFSERLDADRLGLLNMAASTLVKTWGRRANGLFADAALSKRNTLPTTPNNAALLDLSNPSRLSRCEYRVCLLLSNGLHNDAIQDELSITPSTLRTHLRHIYAKTDCASLVELTFKLLSDPARRRVPSRTGLRIA